MGWRRRPAPMRTLHWRVWDTRADGAWRKSILLDRPCAPKKVSPLSKQGVKRGHAVVREELVPETSC
eukprot:3909171-Pyramimonas_sp.AAC.1